MTGKKTGAKIRTIGQSTLVVVFVKERLGGIQARLGASGYSEDFSAVVTVLMWRARRLLAREADIGAGLRVRGDGRIDDDELRARVGRLKGVLDELAAVTEALATTDDKVAADAISLARSALDLAEDRLESALWLTWERLDFAADRLTKTFEREAEAHHPGLRLAGSAEIEALAEDAPARDTALFPPSTTPDDDDPEAWAEDDDDDAQADSEDAGDLDPQALIRLAAICEAAEGARAALAEVRALYIGRLCRAAGRGQPEHERGRWLVAQLLGLAEKLGLPRYAKSESAIDAVVEALEDLRTDPADGPDHAILAEAPRTREAIERRLIQDICSDPRLTAAYADGERMADLHILQDQS